jgi:hypothetical protein
MPKYRRVALFLDYENLYNTLQKRSRTETHRYGFSPHLDFKQLVEYICKNYGGLQPRDFFAVANFSHYDPQKGSLNQVATLVAVDSFEPRTVRQVEQSSPGKKFVIKDYADIRLAYEVGHHVALQPADLYILGSNDKAMAAIGRALIQVDIPAIFLLPDPELAAVIIKENFDWFSFDSTQSNDETSTQFEDPEALPQHTDPADDLVATISDLRQALSTPVPVALIESLYGVEHAHQLLARAQSQGRVDLWEDEHDVACASLREERIHDLIVKHNVRAEIAERSALLRKITIILEHGLNDPTGAGWRRELKDSAGLSSREAKILYADLQQAGILRLGNLNQVFLTTETALKFLQK